MLINSSSTANFVEGLCTYFISNPDNPDSMDVMRGAIDALEDLRQCAQSVVDSVIDKFGTGSRDDLSRARESVSQIRRLLLAVEDVFAHAMLGVDYLIEAHGQRKLKHQITQDDTSFT